MRGKLFSKQEELQGLVFRIADEATIGRAPGNSIVLAPRGISSRHARIFLDRELDCYQLEDLGSLNGTRLDDAPVQGCERLGHLHVITFAGSYDFIFQDLELGARRHPGVVRERGEDRTGVERHPPPLPTALAGTPVASGTMVEKAGLVLPPNLGPPPADDASAPSTTSRTPRLPLLEVSYPEGGRECFALRPGENRIGRAPEVEIFLDRQEISRWHAVLTVSPDRVTVSDQGSANHTFVGGRRAEGEVVIAPGDKLRFGNVEARLIEQQDD